MIFLSILAKTLALTVGPHRLWLGLLLWAAGAVADVVALRRARGEDGGEGVRREVLFLQAGALVLGWAAAEAAGYGAMRWKEGIFGLSHLAGGLLRAVGLPVGTDGGVIYLTTMAGPLEFAASLDHLGARIPFVMWILAAAWLLWTSRSFVRVLHGLTVVALVLLAVVVVRSGLVIVLFLGLADFIGYESEELPFRPFVDPEFVAWSYLPILLAAWPLLARALGSAVPIPPVAVEPDGPVGGHRRWWLAGVPAALVLATVVLWQPAGSRKDGKVLLNTWHTQWSRTDRPYDRDWYGADSGYNYACMKRLFGKYYPVEELQERIRAEDLAGASVLVIFDPDRRFSDDELRLVRDFVRGGGGLFVIGDHTNVFGSTSHLNELCGPFGFQFRDDVLFDLDADFHQVLEDGVGRTGIGHGISLFKLRGPASIRPTSLATRSIFEIGNSKAVRAIYSVNNFYPPPHDHPRMDVGTFCIAAAAHHGRGRVMAWGDSTVFSNFEIFYPGKYEYLLNSMEWLNHRDSLAGNLLRRAALVVLLGAAGVALWRRREPRAWAGILAVLAVTWFAARAVTAAAERARSSFPEPVQPMRALHFAARIDTPGYRLRDFTTEESYDRRYDIFIQWVLRTGVFSGFYLLDPGRENAYYDHLREAGEAVAGLAVIVRREDELEFIGAVAKELEEADRHLLIMAGGSVGADRVAGALQDAGLVTAAGELDAVRAAWPAGEAVIESGGRRIMVVASAERFSDQAMGITEK
ncbi:MAG: hypothetical protein HKO57_05675, partial [Akkermansiaceae bacterium]|nr:hypothetical protein [Akkermansiaceae bacterium]